MELIASVEVGETVIRVLQGDITLAETDAIVNAANPLLKHGGGVAGAIVRRGGEVIQQESDAVGFVPTGQVAVTGAGSLAAGYVIHAVGPLGHDPEGDQKLQSAVDKALAAATELQIGSISLPAISSGIFGFPKDRCAEILVSTARQYLLDHSESSLRQVDFVLFDSDMTDLFAHALASSPSS